MLNILSRARFLIGDFCQRKSRSLVYCILLYCVTLSAWANEPDSAIGWIKAMMLAIHSKNYSQTFIYENQSGISTIKLLHANIDGHKYEKLIFLNGPEREFSKKDNQIVALHSNHSETTLDTPTLKSLPFSQFSSHVLDKLQKFYLVSNSGDGRIAGHPCVRIVLQPKDNFRYGYKLWIDKTSNLLLRVDLISETKTVLDRFMVTQLIVPAHLSVKDFSWPEQLKPPVKASQKKTSRLFPWNISWLPVGFTLINSNTIISPVNNETVHYALYSDGLSSFSVYVEKDTSRVLSQSADKFGATSAVSRVFKDGKNAYYNVTVIGELPLGAAERIAVSLQPDNKTD